MTSAWESLLGVIPLQIHWTEQLSSARMVKSTIRLNVALYRRREDLVQGGNPVDNGRLDGFCIIGSRGRDSLSDLPRT